MWNASRFCVSSLRRGHANLLCIVPILVYVLPKQVHHKRGIDAYPSSLLSSPLFLLSNYLAEKDSDKSKQKVYPRRDSNSQSSD